MRKKIMAIIMALLLLSVIGVYAKSEKAKGPHNKATGDVIWTSAPGLAGYRTVFNAHDNAPGEQSDRGIVILYHPDGGMRVTAVECVEVIGNEAWFAGEVIEADGAFDGQVGVKTIYWAKDVGTPGASGDMIGATKGFADPCSQLGTWRGGGTVTAGNLKVHTYE